MIQYDVPGVPKNVYMDVIHALLFEVELYYRSKVYSTMFAQKIA